MDANAPEWIRLLVTEMRAFLNRQERRDSEWRQEQERRDEQWRREQKERDEQWRREQNERDEKRRKEQEHRDLKLYDGLTVFARASDAREKRFLETVDDIHRLQAVSVGLQREILKQGQVTHALLRDILRTLRMGLNGHGRGLSRN